MQIYVLTFMKVPVLTRLNEKIVATLKLSVNSARFQVTLINWWRYQVSKAIFSIFDEGIWKFFINTVIREKEFYCSIDNKYRKFYFVHGSLKSKTISKLFGNHPEGDTRVMFHAKHADTKGPGNIIIQCNDTDISIILQENVQKLPKSHFWFEIELDSDNSQNLIYPNYLKNLIMQRSFQESKHILAYNIYLYFTEKGK